MKKSTIKILYCVLTLVLMISLTTSVFGFSNPSAVSPDATSMDTFDVQMGQILGVIQGIGIGLAVIILVVIGIKYMMGSSEEKAEYKKTMIPYVVGAVIIGAAPTIANIIYNFF